VEYTAVLLSGPPMRTANKRKRFTHSGRADSRM
jgi:hypothetical protein